MDSRTTPLIGFLMVAISIIHSVFGLIMFRGALADGFGDGFIGAWQNGEPASAFWFLGFGAVALILGLAIIELERAGASIRTIAISLLILAIVGIAAYPVSGFWLVLIVAILALVRSRRRRRADEAAGGALPALGETRSVPSREP